MEAFNACAHCEQTCTVTSQNVATLEAADSGTPAPCKPATSGQRKTLSLATGIQQVDCSVIYANTQADTRVGYVCMFWSARNGCFCNRHCGLADTSFQVVTEFSVEVQATFAARHKCMPAVSANKGCMSQSKLGRLKAPSYLHAMGSQEGCPSGFKNVHSQGSFNTILTLPSSILSSIVLLLNKANAAAAIQGPSTVVYCVEQ